LLSESLTQHVASRATTISTHRSLPWLANYFLLTFPVIARSIFFPKMYHTITVGKPSLPSWFHCQLHSYIAFLTCRSPPQAFVIYLHLRQSRLFDPLNGPFQTYAAITYTTTYSTPKVLQSLTSLSLASSLLLISPSTPKKFGLAGTTPSSISLSTSSSVCNTNCRCTGIA